MVWKTQRSFTSYGTTIILIDHNSVEGGGGIAREHGAGGNQISRRSGAKLNGAKLNGAKLNRAKLNGAKLNGEAAVTNAACKKNTPLRTGDLTASTTGRISVNTVIIIELARVTAPVKPAYPVRRHQRRAACWRCERGVDVFFFKSTYLSALPSVLSFTHFVPSPPLTWLCTIILILYCFSSFILLFFCVYFWPDLSSLCLFCIPVFPPMVFQLSPPLRVAANHRRSSSSGACGNSSSFLFLFLTMYCCLQSLLY